MAVDPATSEPAPSQDYLDLPKSTQSPSPDTKSAEPTSARVSCWGTRSRRPEDDITPPFGVFVLSRPVGTKRHDGVNVPMSSMRKSEIYMAETYCGTPIIIPQSSGAERRCTFGGIIKTVSLNGDVKLYGLTVGPALFGDSSDVLAAGTMRDGAKPIDGEEFQHPDTDNEDEPDDLTDDFESPHAIESLQSVWGNAPDTSESSASLELSKIGFVSATSMQAGTATPNANGKDSEPFYDWALIDMESYKPNRLPGWKLPNSEVQDGAFRSGDLVMSAMPPHNSGKREPVLLLRGSKGPTRGYLSGLPSKIILSPGTTFIDTFILNLDGDNEFLDGNSGSWVVNETTLEVYGYFIAVDGFGGGYIVPIHEAFRDIAHSVGVLSVDIATAADMAPV